MMPHLEDKVIQKLQNSKQIIVNYNFNIRRGIDKEYTVLKYIQFLVKILPIIYCI